MSRYSECHKYFLQSLMQKGVATEQECTTLLNECCEICDVEAGNLSLVISTINKEIRPFHLEIRKGNNEDDGTDVYALISSTDHDINHLVIGGIFSKNEIEIFHRMVDIIVASPDGTVSSTDVLNLTDDLPQKNISKSDVEVLINKLVKQQWIGEKDGIIHLTPRSVLELEPYLKSELKDMIIECGICKNMVLRGLRCTRCRTKIHTYCAETYYRGRTASDRKCPNCHEAMLFMDSSSIMADVNGDVEMPTTSERRKRRR